MAEGGAGRRGGFTVNLGARLGLILAQLLTIIVRLFLKSQYYFRFASSPAGLWLII